MWLGKIYLIHQLDHSAHRMANISANRMVDDLVLIMLGSIYIYMNDLSLWGEFRYIAGYPIIETNAKGQEQIAIVDSEIPVSGPVHSKPLERKGMRFRERSHSHQSRRAGDSRPLNESAKLVISFRRHDTAPVINHGTLGFFY